MNSVVNGRRNRWLIIVLLLAHAVYAAPAAHTLYSFPVPGGLLGWWTGDANLLDSTGTNKARLYNGADYAPGEVGQGFHFDGLKSYVKVIATAQEMEAKTGLTVELWVNPADISYKQPLLGWSGGETAGVYLWLTPGKKPGFAILNVDLKDDKGASHLLATGAGVVEAGRWQHIALTYNETTGDALLFVNSRPVALQLMDSFKPNTKLDLWLGRHSAVDEGRTYFGGVMDEISVYNRALSPGEIEAIYKAGSAGKSILVPLALETGNEQREQAMQRAYDDRLKSFITKAPTSTLTFEAFIDGTDEVHIQGDQLWYEHQSWNLPGVVGNTKLPTRVNLRDWIPAWNGNTSDKTTIAPPPPTVSLDAAHQLQMEVAVLRGGGTVTVKQAPTADNGYETILFMDDGMNPGAHWYTFSVTWNSAPAGK